MTHERLAETGKHAIDTASGVTVLGTLFGYLPEISALASLIWVLIRIYETETVQKLLGRKKQ